MRRSGNAPNAETWRRVLDCLERLQASHPRILLPQNRNDLLSLNFDRFIVRLPISTDSTSNWRSFRAQVTALECYHREAIILSLLRSNLLCIRP